MCVIKLLRFHSTASSRLSAPADIKTKTTQHFCAMCAQEVDSFFSLTCTDLCCGDSEELLAVCRNIPMSSSCPDCPAPVITLAPVAALSDELRNARHFMARSVMEGCAARTLADTGADTNFVSQDFVTKHGLVITACKPRAIRLGNNSLHHINTCVVAETYIGQMKFKVSYLVMPLAHGIDSVLGRSSVW